MGCSRRERCQQPASSLLRAISRTRVLRDASAACKRRQRRYRTFIFPVGVCGWVHRAGPAGGGRCAQINISCLAGRACVANRQHSCYDGFSHARGWCAVRFRFLEKSGVTVKEIEKCEYTEQSPEIEQSCAAEHAPRTPKRSLRSAHTAAPRVLNHMAVSLLEPTPSRKASRAVSLLPFPNEGGVKLTVHNKFTLFRFLSPVSGSSYSAGASFGVTDSGSSVSFRSSPCCAKRRRRQESETNGGLAQRAPLPSRSICGPSASFLAGPGPGKRRRPSPAAADRAVVGAGLLLLRGCGCNFAWQQHRLVNLVGISGAESGGQNCLGAAAGVDRLDSGDDRRW